MKNIITWLLAIMMVSFLIYGFFYLSARRERCESYGGLLVKDALAGWVCVAKSYEPKG